MNSLFTDDNLFIMTFANVLQAIKYVEKEIVN